MYNLVHAFRDYNLAILKICNKLEMRGKA